MDNQFILKAKGPDSIEKIDFELKSVAIPTEAGVDFGINETLDVVDLGIDFGVKLAAAFADGKINLGEAIGLGAVLIQDLPSAYSGINMVPVELKNIKKAHIDTLKKHVIEKLNCSEEKAQMLIQKSIDFVYSGWDLYREIAKVNEPETGADPTKASVPAADANEKKN